jgi:hypothetical protein
MFCNFGRAKGLKSRKWASWWGGPLGQPDCPVRTLPVGHLPQAMTPGALHGWRRSSELAAREGEESTCSPFQLEKLRSRRKKALGRFLLVSCVSLILEEGL